MQIMINCSNFRYGLKDHTKCLCTKFEVIWTNKAELWAKEVGELYYVAQLPQYKHMEIFKTLNSCNSFINWYINLKLTERDFEMGLFTLCRIFVKKVVNLNFDDVIANQE